MLNLFVGLDIYTGLLLLLALAFVLFYEAINGFHDTANAVAAVIYTRAMQPQLAVVMAAFFNFFGVLLGGLREGANKRGNSSRLTQSFHFFMFEPIFSPVNALNQP
ncbi:inorganic phosphate transporter, partial [Escherichia coli]